MLECVCRHAYRERGYDDLRLDHGSELAQRLQARRADMRMHAESRRTPRKFIRRAHFFASPCTHTPCADAGVERGGARGERSPRGAMGVLELPNSRDVGDQAGAGEVEGETTRLAVSWSKP